MICEQVLKVKEGLRFFSKGKKTWAYMDRAKGSHVFGGSRLQNGFLGFNFLLFLESTGTPSPIGTIPAEATCR